MNKLEEIIKYQFNDEMLIKTALSHSSFANESKSGIKCNERLEFLGDSVLSIVVSEYLFERFKNQPEGDLTKIRAALVCEKSLHKFALEINLGEFIYLGKGEERTGGRQRPSILADAFEALIAAIYLDGGFEPAKEFVLPFIIEALKHELEDELHDYKTALQEIIQKNPEEHVEDKIIEEEHREKENNGEKTVNDIVPEFVKNNRTRKLQSFDLHPEISNSQRNQFVITDDNLGVGTPKEKFKNNIEAIKVLKKCEEEKRYATKEEQEILSRYVGWGGLQEAFDSKKDSWNKEYEELKSLLTEEEYTKARESTLTAFYTPPVVIRSIYKVLSNMGLKDGNILEPSARNREFYW